MKNKFIKFKNRLAGAWSCLTSVNFEMWVWYKKHEKSVDLYNGPIYEFHRPLTDGEFLTYIVDSSLFCSDIYSNKFENTWTIFPEDGIINHQHTQILDRYNKDWSFNAETQEITIARNNK